MKPEPPVTRASTRFSFVSARGFASCSHASKAVEHMARLIVGHHRRDGETHVAPAKVFGDGQLLVVAERREHALLVTRQFVDLAAQEDLELPSPPLLESTPVPAPR